MFRRINALLIGLLVFATLFTPAQAAPSMAGPGELDPTFGGFGGGGVVAETGVSGAVLAQLGNQNGMARQPDGKIVTVGSKQANLVVFRYLPNGQRDATFSGDGTVEIAAPTGLYLKPNDVAVQLDGKIIVAGQTDVGDNSDFLLVRLTASGELDSGFGDGGFVTTNFTGNGDAAYSVLVQPDGKIAVCGEARISGDEDFAVARYLPNGALDTSFSGDGKATIGFGEYDSCYNMALQNDGKLMLVGQTREIFFDYDVASARLNRNGTLDTSYSGDGKLISNYGYREEGRDVAIQPDGKIVLLGGSVHSSTGYIARYLPNGDRDTATFGNGTGIVSIPTAFLFDLELLPDGRLVALGCHICDIYSDGTDFAFYRLLANGNLDPTFNEIGMLWPDFGSAFEYGTDLALLPDGRILGFGTSYGTSEGSKLILAQLWPDGKLDTGGRQTHGVSPGFRETAFALAAQPDGKLLVAGEAHYWLPGFENSNVFLSRFHANGQVDTSFGTLGNAQIPFVTPPLTTMPHRGVYAVAVQPDGKIVAVGYSRTHPNTPADFLVLRWNSNGTPDTSFGSGGWKLINFLGNGEDQADALAIQPDGKILVVGSIWNGSRMVWGMIRLTSTGAVDTTFGPSQDGRAYLNFNERNTAHAVVIQSDGKIVWGGYANGDFVVARLLSSGLHDAGFGSNGVTITDLGGEDVIRALALGPGGRLHAAGYSIQNGNADMVLTQYFSNGQLAKCTNGNGCDYWPEGKRFVNMGGFELATSLVMRGNNQLVVAGCSNGKMAAAQVSTTNVNAPLLFFQTDFVGQYDCALGVALGGGNKVILAGQQVGEGEGNIALARFQTTPATVQAAGQLDQTIAFPELPNYNTTDSAFELSASASSGLPVSFTSSTPDICTVSGATLTLTGQRGTCTIAADQAGDATYLPAPTVTNSFSVGDQARQEQTITIEPDPLPTKLERDQPFTLAAKASSGLPLEIVSATPEICAVVDTAVVGLAEGRCTISVSQAGDAQWKRVRVKLRFKIVAGRSR